MAATEAADAAAAVDALLQEQDAHGVSIAGIERAHARLAARAAQAGAAAPAEPAPAEADEPPSASAQVSTLLDRLAALQEDARSAENNVGRITSEIRWLDAAKSNVSLSIVTLKRLQMLINSTFQLEQLCADRQYRDAASTLQALQSLLALFEPHTGVECVVQLRRQVQELRTQLRGMVMDEYDRVLAQGRGRWTARDTVLPDAALAADALGPEVRDALVDWYCTTQLRDYRRVFRASDEAGQLDNVPRRYAWFRRVLRTYTDEHAAAFVPEWHVDRELLARFTEITREDLRSVLIRQQTHLDVQVLLAALNASVEFEQQVARQYSMPFTRLLQEHESQAADAASARPGALQRPALHAGAAPPSSGTERPRTPPTISATFNPYLGVFVDAQDKKLAEMHAAAGQQGEAAGATVDGAAGASPWAPQAGEPMTVLVSSTELFRFYRQALERCAQLGDHAPLRELGRVFAKWLQRYASEVLRPALHTQGSADAAETHRVCIALNTADYCITTTTQLEQRLTEKLRANARDAAPVELRAERDAFAEVTAAAVQALVRQLAAATAPAFQALVRPEQPWAQLETLSEKSAWVDQLASALEGVGVVVRQEVDNKRYVRGWCDRAVALVAARITQGVLRLRPLRPRTAQQLLADVRHVQQCLVELPHFGAAATWGSTPSASAQASYQRHVERSMARISPVLEMLAGMGDEAPSPGSTVELYLRHIGDQSMPNFQKILDLKGVRRPEQSGFVDEFLAAIDRDPSLPTTSFLSSMDMDPNAEVYAMHEPGDRARAPPREGDADAGGMASSLSGLVGASAGVLPRPGTPTSAAAAASRGLPDWKKFGNMLGVALGRDRRQ